MPYSLPTGAAGRCDWAVWLYMSSHTGQYSGAHTTKHTPCIESLRLYDRAELWPAATMADDVPGFLKELGLDTPAKQANAGIAFHRLKPARSA